MRWGLVQMRIIKLDLPAVYRLANPEISLVAEEIRNQLFQQLEQMDYEISEHVRQRASTYLPRTYSVFVRTQLRPEKIGAVTELWIVDPTVRWPAGLLTRSAWKLFVPILSNVVRDTTMQRFSGVEVEMQEKDARVTVLAPTRSWRDPVILSAGVFALTSLLWFALVPLVRGDVVVPKASPTAALTSQQPTANTGPVVNAEGPAWKSLDTPQSAAMRARARAAEGER